MFKKAIAESALTNTLQIFRSCLLAWYTFKNQDSDMFSNYLFRPSLICAKMHTTAMGDETGCSHDVSHSQNCTVAQSQKSRIHHPLPKVVWPSSQYQKAGTECTSMAHCQLLPCA